MFRPTHARLARHHLALLARTQSTPLDVLARRAKKRKRLGLNPTSATKTDANAAGLSPTELARYTRMKHIGELGGVANEPTDAEWLSALNTRRTRLRGVRSVKLENGRTENHVLGKPIYLPNIIFKFVPNFTPPGEEYNPFEATFRIPHGITKTDVRSYLLAVYGVECTYIRTDNYFGRVGKNDDSYKRAVVGLVKPFYYPLQTETMTPEDAKKRADWLESAFNIEANKDNMMKLLMKMTNKHPADWNWRYPMSQNRSTILKRIAESRQAREGLVARNVQDWQNKRAKGERIKVDRKRLVGTGIPKPRTAVQKIYDNAKAREAAYRAKEQALQDKLRA